MSDSATMLRRSLTRIRRYPSMTVMLVGIPVIFLLLFVYVFGGAMGSGIGGPSGGRGGYANYVVPGIILITVASTSQGTAISVAMDMTEGIINRFRTMAISRASVLTGHVLGSMLQTMFSIVVVVGIALLIGFRPTANPVEWIAATGLLTLFTLGLTWLTVALGLMSRSVETASNTPMILVLLPFLGSGFVPTDSMPAALRAFAEYQPFTPVMETLRGLLLGSPIGNNAVIAQAWCVVITVGGYLLAKKMFNREPRT
jgi:ABC-2 type transport system permease protein